MTSDNRPDEIPFESIQDLRAAHMRIFLQERFSGFAADGQAAKIMGALLGTHLILFKNGAEYEETENLCLQWVRSFATDKEIKDALCMAEFEGVIDEIPELKWPECVGPGDPTPPWKPLKNWQVRWGANMPPLRELLGKLPSLLPGPCEKPSQRRDDAAPYDGDTRQAMDIARQIGVHTTSTTFRNWLKGKTEPPPLLTGLSTCAVRVGRKWGINLSLLRGLIATNKDSIGSAKQPASKPTYQVKGTLCDCGKTFETFPCPECGITVTDRCEACHLEQHGHIPQPRD